MTRISRLGVRLTRLRLKRLRLGARLIRPRLGSLRLGSLRLGSLRLLPIPAPILAVTLSRLTRLWLRGMVHVQDRLRVLKAAVATRIATPGFLDSQAQLPKSDKQHKKLTLTLHSLRQGSQPFHPLPAVSGNGF
jgi:hypothetical protein